LRVEDETIGDMGGCAEGRQRMATLGEGLAALWALGGTLLLVLAPKVALLPILLGGLVPVCGFWAVRGHFPWHWPSAMLLALYAAGAYLALNATWSPSPWLGLLTAGILLLCIGTVDATVGSLDANQPRIVRAMGVGAAVGVALSGALICTEALDGQRLRLWGMSLLPWLRPDARHTATGAGGELLLLPHLLNRSMAVLTLTLWPALLLARALACGKRERLLWWAALVPSSAAILLSVHTTSKVALVCGALIFGLCLMRPVAARWAAIAGFTAATLLVVPFTSALFAHKLYTAPWLFKSAQMRIVMWGFTSEQVGKHPLLGQGVLGAYAFHAAHRFDAPRAPGTDFQLETGAHSHNAYLQVWYEAGAIGAVLLLGFGLLAVRAITVQPPPRQPYLYATFCSSALVAASSFNIWEPWFLSTLAITGVLVGFGCSGAMWASGVSPPGCAPGSVGGTL
jgi:hypothetical protein